MLQQLLEAKGKNVCLKELNSTIKIVWMMMLGWLLFGPFTEGIN